MSLASQSLLSLVLGVAVGIFLGEQAAALEAVGTIFIQLLQMTVLPYVTVSLIVGLGDLSYAAAIQLARKASLVLGLFWLMSLSLVSLLPLVFPATSSGTFFSTSLIQAAPDFDFLRLYIPSNPFWALANSVVPAVVLFSLAIGVALIGLEEKSEFLSVLRTFANALTRVARFVVSLAPIGVFAIAASAAGTLSPDDFWRLQVFIIPYIMLSLLMTFWLLPGLIAAVTPLGYRDVMAVSRDALVTAFATASLFVVLPVLAERSKELLGGVAPEGADLDGSVDIVTPVSFSFPSSAKLLSLSFIPFAAWYSGGALDASQYPEFLVSGVVSAFGSLNAAVPFLLDLMRIPADMFDLYVATGVVNARFGTLLAAAHTLAVTILGTCAVHGLVRFRLGPMVRYGAISLLLVGATIGVLRLGFEVIVAPGSKSGGRLTQMSSTIEHVEVVRHTAVPSLIEEDRSIPLLGRIRSRGAIRVGYREFLPMAFVNESDELVGLDIDLARLLARDLGVRLELIPVPFGEIGQALEAGVIDIAMPGRPATADAVQSVRFTRSYLDFTIGFGVLDHRRRDFSSRAAVQRLEGLRVGVVGIPYYTELIGRYLPNAEIVKIEGPRSFFEGEAREKKLDAIVFSAEALSAWSLLYPAYSVAVPHPDVVRVPLAFPVARREEQMASMVSAWIQLKEKEGVLKELYDYWILGRRSEEKSQRWSVIRNVLGWVD